MHPDVTTCSEQPFEGQTVILSIFQEWDLWHREVDRSPRPLVVHFDMYHNLYSWALLPQAKRGAAHLRGVGPNPNLAGRGDQALMRGDLAGFFLSTTWG